MRIYIRFTGPVRGRGRSSSTNSLLSGMNPIPRSAKCCRNSEHLKPFFAYPADIHKVIYTTNAVESLNMSLGK